MGQKESLKENFKIHITTRKLKYTEICGGGEATRLREKQRALSAFIKKEERSQVNDPSSYLKKKGKEE